MERLLEVREDLQVFYQMKLIEKISMKLIDLKLKRQQSLEIKESTLDYQGYSVLLIGKLPTIYITTQRTRLLIVFKEQLVEDSEELNWE